MANIDNAFRIERLSLDDSVLITQGLNDPTILSGYEAPIGSLYLRSNGELYQKINTADVDWVKLSTSAGSSDHGSLSGLGDDDHLQYLNETRGDLRYYTQTQADTLFASQAELDNVETSLGAMINSADGTWNGFSGTTYIDAATSVDNAIRILDANISAGANTASNVGVGGVGIFDTKNGVTLEFKNINAGSNKVTITDDPTNKEVDVDIVEANISHLNIGDIGTNTHTQIDTHIADTSVHFSTIDGLSDVVITTPTNNQVLTYNGANWVNLDPTGGSGGSATVVEWVYGTIPAVQGTAVIPLDNTAPLITEGVPLWSRALTPSSTTSSFRITQSLAFSVSNSASILVVAVFRDNTCIGTMVDVAANKDAYQTISFGIQDEPNTTSPITYSCRVGRGTGNATWYVNSSGSGNDLGGTLTSNSYIIQEVAGS